MSVADALRLMAPNRYYQVTVVADGRVRGVFSLWSLIYQLLAAPDLSPLDLAVEDVMESIPTVTVDDPLDLVLDEHLEPGRTLCSKLRLTASAGSYADRL